MEADARLDLRLVHLVGIGKREATEYIDTAALHHQLAVSHCTVALYVGHDVAYLYLLELSLIDFSIHLSYRQLAAFLLAHLGRAGLGDVELEVGFSRHLANIGHAQDLSQHEGVGTGRTIDVFVQFVETEVEVDVSASRIQQTLERLLLPQHAEVARIVDGAQVMQLFHHELLDRKLADDALFGTPLCRHLVDVEANGQLLFVLQSRNATIGTDGEFLVQCSYADVLEPQVLGIAAEVHTQRQGYREVAQYGCKRTGYIL